jgi:hypothetical protein
MNDEVAVLVALYITLDRAWRNPPTINSRFAREGAAMVALSASEGFITTNCGDDSWGNKWLITERGMTMKEDLDDQLRHIFEQTND